MISKNAIQSVGLIQDKQGRYLYPIPAKSLAYVVPEKKLSLFYFLRNRYLLIIILTFFIFTLRQDPILTGAFALIALATAELYYRNVFLPRLTTLKNFTVAATRLGKPVNPTQRLIHLSLYIALAAAIAYLGYSKYLSSPDFYLYIVGALATVVYGYYQVFIRRRV